MNQKNFNTSIYITDEQIGIFYNHKNDDSLSKATDLVLEDGSIELGYIKDPVSLYKNIKKTFKKAKIKAKKIHWIIPDSNILIRKIQVLKMDIENTNLNDYLKNQIGDSIKNPFEIATFSYEIIEESEIDFQIILYIADQNLIEDYLDVFEKCGIKEIQYGLVSASVYHLLEKEEKIEERSLVVSLYDPIITINIIENQTTIFGMIDELPNHAISVQKIEEYVERITNYYQFNLRKGKFSIKQVIVLDVSKKNKYLNQMSELSKVLSPKFSFLFIDFKTRNSLLADYNSNVDIAYLSASTIQTNYEAPLCFRIERHKKGLIFANYLLVLAVAIIAFVSLLYIPFMNMESEVLYQESINEGLTIQYDLLQNSIDYSNVFTSSEINYNITYTYLDSQTNDPFNYLNDIIDLLNEDVLLTNCFIDGENQKIEISINGTTKNALYEYVISLYETHGILQGPSNEKWISVYPEATFTSTLSMKVVIYYA